MSTYEYRQSEKVRARHHKRPNLQKLFPLPPTRSVEQDEWRDVDDDAVVPLQKHFEDIARHADNELAIANLMVAIKAIIERRGLKKAYALTQSMVDDLALAIVEG
jgi:hypothetical protein